MTNAELDRTGCGFYETVEKLVEMGADMNARDVMSCTPLQNAAHGTYSALAAMPAPGTPNGRLLPHLCSASLPCCNHRSFPPGSTWVLPFRGPHDPPRDLYLILHLSGSLRCYCTL